jgi:hypothetical protein
MRHRNRPESHWHREVADGHDVVHPSMGSAMRLLPLFVATVCCSFAVLAAEPATVAPTRIALHAARLLDVDSGRVLHDPLVAEGDRITNVSEGGSVPAGVQVIDRVGSLAPGHYADMIAVAGDPLSDVSVLEHVGFVMKGGQVVRGPVLP